MYKRQRTNKNDKKEDLVGDVIKIKALKRYKWKTNKYFLKVVQDNALSPTSTISVLPRMGKELQSLDL